MRLGKAINTFSGGQFWPLDPQLDEIKAIDIAHGLSMICRANGHFKHFYSVGQHSIFCALEAKSQGLSTRIQLACLLHDASEAYIGDITRPLKSMMANYLEIEEVLQQQIYAAFGLPDLTSEELHWVKRIDDALLSYEMANLMEHHIASDLSLINQFDLSFQMMSDIKSQFIDHLQQLMS